MLCRHDLFKTFFEIFKHCVQYSVAISERITAKAVQIRETEVNCRPAAAHGSSPSSIKEIHKEWNGTTLKS